MMGRVLDLRPDCLANPVRADLIAIETVLLWPSDEGARAESEQTASVEAGLEIIEQLDARPLRELVEAAAAALPLREIHKRTTVMKGGPYVQGLMAAEILYLSLERTAVGSPDASMKCIIPDVAKQFDVIWSVNPKTIENVLWPKYRSVAHYWAAHRHLMWEHLRIPTQSSYPFPCMLKDLGSFLCIAEAYRMAGESTKMKQAPGPVLRANDSVRLPDGFDLPKMRLEFGADAS